LILKRWAKAGVAKHPPAKRVDLLTQQRVFFLQGGDEFAQQGHFIGGWAGARHGLPKMKAPFVPPA
jgi:hypothetical protein